MLNDFSIHPILAKYDHILEFTVIQICSDTQTLIKSATVLNSMHFSFYYSFSYPHKTTFHPNKFLSLSIQEFPMLFSLFCLSICQWLPNLYLQPRFFLPCIISLLGFQVDTTNSRHFDWTYDLFLWPTSPPLFPISVISLLTNQ